MLPWLLPGRDLPVIQNGEGIGVIHVWSTEQYAASSALEAKDSNH